MKIAVYLIPLALAMPLLCLKAYAEGKEGGGGDLCENRFKAVANDLATWIQAGGAANLSLQHGAQQLTPQAYGAGMLAEISAARITCVSAGDEGYPVTVDGHAKECRNFVDSTGQARILCDREKFYSGLAQPENDSSQYVIVHHEYASLAGFEAPNGDDSQYWISDQITGFLENQAVQKLVVKPASQGVGSFTLRDQTDGNISDASLSPDNRLLGYLHKDQISVVDLRTLQELNTFPVAGEDPAYPLALSADDTLACAQSATLDCYRIASGALAYRIPGPKNSYDKGLVFFTPDGNQLVAIDAGAILLYDAHNGHPIRRFAAYPKSRRISAQSSLSPDGKRLFLGVMDEKGPGVNTSVIDLATGHREFVMRIDAVHVSADGSLLSGLDFATGTAYVFDARTGKESRHLDKDAAPSGTRTDAILLPNGSLMVTYEERNVGMVYSAQGAYLYQITSDGQFRYHMDPSESLVVGMTGTTGQFIASSLRTGRSLLLYGGADVYGTVALSANRILVLHYGAKTEVIAVPGE